MTTVNAADNFTVEDRDALYKIILGRRDIRNFKNVPIPDEVLLRIMQAAHQGPSVGFMQPWDFIMIKSIEVREKVKALFERERESAAAFYDEPQRSHYLSLKLEGILESPINICVTCDPFRGGVVLGRNSIPETDVYSTCCAIQNLWLAARSEGVGVGWVSIIKQMQLRQILGMPHHIVPVGYLCLGYPTEFPKRPTLEEVGWRNRLDIKNLIHFEKWGQETNAGWKEFGHSLRDSK
jgi:5,6-dimethylbenzimidazole synthase